MFFRLISLFVFEMTGLDKSQQLCLIFRCPALKHFQWSGTIRTLSLRTLFQTAGVISLDILGRPDTDVASILQGIGNQHGGQEQSSRALELHFSTLVELDLSCFSVPSTVIRDILCSCPRLEDLSVRCVLVRDIRGFQFSASAY